MPTTPAAHRGGFSLPDPIRALDPDTGQTVQIVHHAQMLAAIDAARAAQKGGEA